MKRNKSILDNTPKFTKDFNQVIKNVIYNSVGFFFLDFILPIYSRQELNATGTQIGLIFSVQIIGSLISSFLSGYLTDKVKNRTLLILIGSIGRGIAYFVIYAAIILQSLYLIQTGTFFIGFFATFFWIPFDTIIAEKSDKAHRSQAYGKRDAAVGKGLFFGGLSGFGLYFLGIEYFQFNPYITYISIILYGLLNFFAGIQFYRKVDESVKIDKPNDITRNSLISEEKSSESSTFLVGFILFCIVILLANINGSLAKPFLNVYIIEEIINDELIASFIYIPAGIAAMYLAPKLGQIVDKIQPKYGIVLVSIIGSIVTFLIININNILFFSILLLFDTIMVNIANLLIQNIYSRVSKSHRGKVMSFYRFFQSFGNIIGPVLGGITLDYINLRAPFMISIIVELFLIPFFLISIYLIKINLDESLKKRKKSNVNLY